MTRTRRAAVLASMLLLAQGLVTMACVDGKTPDCSDPNVQCGPDLDGATDATDAADAADATTTTGADADASTTPETGADADADAPSDASDAG